MPIESADTVIEQLPQAQLLDLSGTLHSLSDLAQGQVTVVIFACNHCPYVQSIERELGAIAAQRPDVSWIAICSNDSVNYPDDDVPGLRAQVERAGWNFPYLIDQDQNIARRFGAVCTPDFFVFDAEGRLVYRGAMDDARPRQPQPVDGVHLLAAIDAASTGSSYVGGKPSMGCGIKWKQD